LEYALLEKKTTTIIQISTLASRLRLLELFEQFRWRPLGMARV